MEKMMAQLQPGELYRERLFNLNAIVVIIFIIIASLMFIDVIGPSRLESVAFFFIIVLVELFLAFNFAVLITVITPSGINVRFGIFHQIISWDNIQSYDYRRNAKSRLGMEILWGLSIGNNEGKSALYYRASFSKDIALIERKESHFKYFGFSTRHPKEIVALIDTWKK